MKDVKFRINADFIINAIAAAILIIGGLCVLFGCIYGIVKLNGGFDLLDFDSEYGRVLSIFILPIILMIYAMIFGAGVLLGAVPATIGLLIAALASVARFSHTEKGTAITKPYTVLMSIANGITCSTFILYALGIILMFARIAASGLSTMN